MGIDSNIYVGAYIELPKVETETVKDIYCCSNESCLQHLNVMMPTRDNFCTVCGSKAEHFKIVNKENKVLNWYNFLTSEDLDDEQDLTPVIFNNQIFLISNKKLGMSFFIFNNYDSVVQELDNSLIEKAIVEYEELFKPYREKIESRYGKLFVVKYGLINYFN